MTDWGIPNWLDPPAYGDDTERWPEHRWRWEFTRRRPDCRADFEAHKDETTFRRVEQSPGAKPGRLLRPDEPGFTAEVPDCYKKYGLNSLPNPAIGDQPFEALLFSKRGPHFLGHIPGEWCRLRFSKEAVVVVFNAAAPIEAQLEAAKKMLEIRQKRIIGKLPGSRKHRKKWLTYLRVLDAHESGVSLSKIAESGVLEGRREDARAAGLVLKAAKALRFKWPA